MDRGRGIGQPNVDRPGQEEVPKIPKFVWSSFMDDLFNVSENGNLQKILYTL